ncbi:MAG: DinB family protein [Planctomycetaceae bacterium]|nr:DinB family protein [Planctomycetaceae bacterium]
MSIIDLRVEQWKFNRDRTLESVKRIAEMADPQAALSWQPGTGRAHVGWQLMHIAITEERFAMMNPGFASSLPPETLSRYGKGSEPDDDVPSLDEIRQTLEHTRANLLAMAEQFSEADLSGVPEVFRERGWTVGLALQIVAWHEPHHQGQAHLTLNLWEASHGK